MAKKLIGDPIDRIDGPAKVTGSARYSADIKRPGMLHGVLVMSTIANGRIQGIDTAAALKVSGVVSVMSHLNAPRLGGMDKNRRYNESALNRQLQLMQDNVVHYNNQPIAMVLGETFEAATEGASRVKVTYQEQKPMPEFLKNLGKAFHPALLARPDDQVNSLRGDMQAGMDAATQRFEQTYHTVLQHHNSLEPHAMLAWWEGDQLHVYNATQGVVQCRERIAGLFAMPEANIHLRSQFIGGGFGSKGTTMSPVILGPLAAKFSGKPVRLVVKREQAFGQVGSRAATQQKLAIASDAQGKFTAMTHHTISQTSTFDEFAEFCSTITRVLYACPNLETTHSVVQASVGHASPMRAPGEAGGVFALESAVDEFAYQLNLDPIQLRLVNYAETDPHKNLPFSSKSLRQCYEKGAERFGWSRRTPQPRSMKDGSALVGMGMATTLYPAGRNPASALVQMHPDGTVTLSIATQDIGVGTYTVLAQVAAGVLGVTPEQVTISAGDTKYPPGANAGGSRGTSSDASAVTVAAEDVLQQLRQMAFRDKKSPLYNVTESELMPEGGRLVMKSNPKKSDAYVSLLKRAGGKPLKAEKNAEPGLEADRYSTYAFGAVFAEVRVDEALGEVRVKRLHMTVAAGRILNEKTALSQLKGGMVWATSMALHEHSVMDPRTNRVMNANLAEYHVAVNADMGELDAVFVEEEDRLVNPAGMKGIGEMGVVGTVAAIANAIYHATGKRHRDLPITPDKVMA